MKRLTTLFAALLVAATTLAQEATLPTPDAKTLGMGGVAMTTLSGSHTIYNNAAMAAFSRLPMQISSSYYGQSDFDYYAVTGYYRIGSANTVQAGWRHYLREGRNSDMSVDLGYTRRIGSNLALGIVGHYMHLKREVENHDALSVDISAAYTMPLEGIGDYSSMRFGAKAGNIGGYFKDSELKLPLDLTVGAAWDTYFSDAHEITLAADMGYYFTPRAVRGFRMGIGAEYNLMQLIQLRAGYHFGERKGYYPSYGSLGAGVRFLHLRLDAAYIIAAKDTPLHNTYSLSFGLDF